MPVTSRRTLVAYKLTCHEARKPDKLFELDSLLKVDSPERSLIFADQIKAQYSKRVLENTVILKSQKFKMKVYCLNFNRDQMAKIFPFLTLD